MTERVGITTTLPIEVPLAAGLAPVDLNNLFIAGEDPEAAVAAAEAAGFPRTACAWTKGLYTTALTAGFRRVVVVEGGDCSNSAALGEVLADAGVGVIGFSYPPRPDATALTAEIARLAQAVGTTVAAAEEVYRDLAPARASLAALDELTWREGRVSPHENYDWLLASSDFGGEPATFRARLGAFLTEARARPAGRDGGRVRLGLAGVPPINRGLFEFLNGLGADVVFNEVPGQFALLGGGATLAEAYTTYTYPYGVAPRLADIRAEISRRRLAGIIHYVQTFCHRGIQDILLRKHAGVPVLTLEGERPGPLSGQQRLRLETFVDVLRPGVTGGRKGAGTRYNNY